MWHLPRGKDCRLHQLELDSFGHSGTTCRLVLAARGVIKLHQLELDSSGPLGSTCRLVLATCGVVRLHQLELDSLGHSRSTCRLVLATCGVGRLHQPELDFFGQGWFLVTYTRTDPGILDVSRWHHQENLHRSGTGLDRAIRAAGKAYWGTQVVSLHVLR